MNQGVDLGRYINADDIARDRGLKGDAGTIAAQLEAERKREECLANRHSFSFETVMSHISKVEFMRRAKAVGYRVTFFFVATDDPALNVLRVQTRVELGGHDVPKDRILARYRRSIANLPAALAICDKTTVFDNSALGGSSGGLSLRPILTAHNSLLGGLWMKLSPTFPVWALEASRVSQFGFEFQNIEAAPDGNVFLQFRHSISAIISTAAAIDDDIVQIATECLQEAAVNTSVTNPNGKNP